MKLTPGQLATFEKDGYLFFPALFTPAEMKTLTDEVPRLYAQHRPENIREKGSDAVRTNFAAPPLQRALREARSPSAHGRPGEADLRRRSHMHQFKINGKRAFSGDVWQWHQDYGTWMNDDLTPEARAMNVAIFLDEVNEFNGPLMFIPGSHRQGALPAGHDTSTTSYPLWTIDHDTISKLVEKRGIVAPKEPAGSMILFHGCLVHASTSNSRPGIASRCT
jgi:ectoine hydroxylase